MAVVFSCEVASDFVLTVISVFITLPLTVHVFFICFTFKERASLQQISCWQQRVWTYFIQSQVPELLPLV